MLVPPISALMQTELALNWTVAVVSVTAFVVTQLTTVAILVKVFKEQMRELTLAVRDMRDEISDLKVTTGKQGERLRALEGAWWQGRRPADPLRD